MLRRTFVPNDKLDVFNQDLSQPMSICLQIFAKTTSTLLIGNVVYQICQNWQLVSSFCDIQIHVRPEVRIYFLHQGPIERFQAGESFSENYFLLCSLASNIDKPIYQTVQY